MTLTASELSEARRALLMNRLRGGADTRSGAVVPRRAGDGPVPLSPAQHGVWLADQFRPDNTLSGVYRVLWLHGRLDTGALDRALAALADRHEVLRSTYRDTENGPVQTAGAGASPPLRVVPMSAPTAQERRAKALALAKALADEPFDLAAGPVFAATLARVDDEEHLLVLRMHHLVTDEVSCAILGRELGALYTAQRAERAADLPELPIRYTDYAAWSVAEPQRRRREAQVEHWREALRGVPPVLELPTDYARPEVPGYRGALETLTLGKETAQGLRRFAAAQGTTMFSTLLTLFSTVLSRHSGQRGFAVGTLLSGRGVPEVESVVGMFANTVAIPVDLTGRPSFAAAVRATTAAVGAALDNQDVPLDQLVTALRIPREASLNPLFQVIFQCVEAAEHPWHFEGLRSEPVEVDTGKAKVDLTLIAVNDADSVELELTYATDLYNRDTARRLLTHLANLAAVAIAAPQTPVEDAAMLTGAELHQAVATWNDTDFEFPADATVHQLVEQQAERNPDLPAIRTPDGASVSFRELNERANRLAHYLRAQGIGSESLVGVCVNHSVEMFTALLGVLKSGAAYVPLDAKLPADRMNWILADTAAPIVLTTDALSATVREAFEGAVLRVDADWESAGIDEHPAGNPEPRTDPDNLLYIIHTSGSTGRPKGVLVPHRGVVNYLAWAVDGYGLDGERGAPMLGSIAFDMSVPNFWLPLIGGKCVTLIPEEAGAGLEALAALLREPHDFSLLKITPGHLDVLRGALPPASVSSVRTFVVGADEVRPETVAGWRRVAPGARIINEYGPTETVVGCSIHVIPEDFDASVSVPIGRPIGNLTMYVLDGGLNPVPVGTVGELYIGGVGVARGYHRLPAMTAEKFIPDPFGRPGTRLYRTGDLARYRADGAIDFLGRTDSQVKIRGYRIELGEVEARLGLHPAVREAVAAAVADETGHKRLVGFVVPADPAAPPSAAELRAFTAAALPDYMVPALFVVLDAMPLTSAAKVDRGRLPALIATRSEGSGPSTANERILAEIWQEVLGVAKVGARDNFFDLGGDSLLAVRVVARAGAAGLALAPTSLFRHQTVAELAEAVEAAAPTAAQSPEHAGFPLAGLPPEALAQLAGPEVTDVYRLTPLQTGMLFQTLAAPTQTAYVDEFVYSLEGEVDEWALRDAWQHVVNRHDCLRSTFAWRGLPHAVQRVHAQPEIDWTVEDWRGLEPAELSRRLTALRDTQVPLDTAPPLRFWLVRVAAREYRLVWLFHHMLLDGWSMPIVLGEFFAVYQALADERRLPELPEPVPFRSHVAWLAGQDPARSARFWRDALGGVAAQPSPSIVAPGDEETGARTDEVSLVLAPEVQARVTAAAQRHRITVATLLHAAWGLALAVDSGRTDVVFGGMSAGRNHGVPDADRIVGMLMNTLPVRVRLGREPVGEWLRRINFELAALREYEYCGLADAKRAAGVPAGQQLFDTVFVYENFADPDVSPLTRLEMDLVGRHIHSGAPVVIGASLHEDLRLTLTFDPDRVTGQGAREQLAVYSRLLERLSAPEARLADLVPALRDAAGTDSAAAAAPLPPAARPVAPAPAPAEAAPEEGASLGQLMAGLWAEVLGVPSVESEENFLDLGGDSILAMRIAARARDMGLLVRPGDLFTYPTVTELVRHGVRPLPGKPAAPVPSAEAPAARPLGAITLDEVARRIPADEVAAVHPLMPAQLGILFHVLGDEPARYAQVFAYRIPEALDEEALRAAWQAVIDRHDALRSTFLWEDLPQPVQVVHSRAAAQLRVLDWTELPQERRADRWQRLLAHEQTAPVDLAAAPPVRIIAVRYADGFDLIWHSHHILLDGLSVAAGLQELADNYQAASAGRALPQRAAPGAFADYVAWARAQDPAAERDYWRRSLSGAELPTPLPPAAAPASGTGTGWHRVEVPSELVEALEQVRRRQQVSFAAMMSAAWGSVLARAAGREDVVFGVTLSGRTAPVAGVDGMVGMLLNTLPLRVDTREVLRAGTGLRQVHERLTELSDHEYGSLTEATRAARLKSGQTVFGSILVVHNVRHGAGLHWPGLSAIDLPENTTSGYPLVFEATWHDGLQLQLNYRRDQYAERDAVELVERFQQVLRQLADAEGCAREAAPRASIEETLAAIWAELLEVPSVGLHDDFFDLGGDSILAIQTVSHVRRLGLMVTTDQVMKHPTVASLAELVRPSAPAGWAGTPVAEPARTPQPSAAPADPDRAARSEQDVPLTPIIRWFTELDWPHDHYNQGAVLHCAGAVDPAALREALRTLVARHEALRTRLVRAEDGWRQYAVPAESADPLNVIDAGDEPADGLPALVVRVGTEVHTGISLEHGPILRGALLRGAADGDLLVLAAHHIAVDTVSWGILVEELNSLLSGAELPPTTSTFGEWARRLAQYAASEQFEAERAAWGREQPPATALPVDLTGGANTEGSAVVVSVELPAELDATVLRSAASGYDARVNELLIAALARAVSGFTHDPQTVIDIETHGREDLFDDVDLFRTVGWFTAVHPLHLRLPGEQDAAGTVRAVKERLRAIRYHGIGFGLAHTHPVDAAAIGAKVPTSAQVVFNYHGQIGRATGSVFSPADLESGETRAGAGIRPYLIEIDAGLANGRLVMGWKFSDQVHRRATVEQLSESFTRALEYLVLRKPTAARRSGAESALSDELLRLMRDHAVPGLSVARLDADGVTGAWGLGVRVAGGAAQVEPNTAFQAGSMSKVVAALTTLSLVQEGTLDLDADIREQLALWRPERRLTLRQLLSHTSGLDRDTPVWFRPGEELPRRAELLAGLRQAAEPGTRHLYANGNYLVIEQLLTDVTGTPYPKLAQARVLDPLGMRHSSVAYNPPIGAGLALGHRQDEQPVVEGWRVGPSLAAGGLWTTASDVAKAWSEILRARGGRAGAVLRPATARLMTTQVGDFGYGLGSFVRHVGAPTVIGHGGDVPGYHCLALCRPEEGEGTVLLANSDSAGRLLAAVFARIAGN